MLFCRLDRGFAIVCFVYLLTLSLAVDLHHSRVIQDRHSFIERDGVNYTIFDHEATGAQLEYVSNSGVCETTSGVRQYSGYLNAGSNMSMWFWFFEARHLPESAPLGLWLNGGPGCSSMIGLFQENGPCRFVGNSNTPSVNPHSWNEYANMLYVDQPVGVGFSYGDATAVNSTATAAPLVWQLLQAFLASFSQYQTRDLGLFTESYGGHYGPGFVSYFRAKNEAIASHQIHGHHINLVALGINNGWYDAIIQEREFISFSLNNTYFPLINSSVATAYLSDYYSSCLPSLNKCTSTTGLNAECSMSWAACGAMDDKFAGFYPDIDRYDIRQNSSSPFPPETYVTYLSDPEVLRAIGAKVHYTKCSRAVADQFHADADGNRSYLPTLSALVQSGLRVLIWAGDADSVCDWFGGLASANNISWSGGDTFRENDVGNYTVEGAVGGEYKTVENLSWLRVFGSGHEVAAFQPALALQVFKQTLGGQGIYST